MLGVVVVCVWTRGVGDGSECVIFLFSDGCAM